MSRLNLLIALNSYNDRGSTNAASHNGIRWTRELDCLPAMNAGSTEPFALAPGETTTLFSTLRTTDQDDTTQYSLTLNPTNPNSYTLTATGGTLPNFRTPRVTGADATTQVTVTLNGPIATFSSGPGQYAYFSGQIPGMILNVTITANNPGSAGNSVVLPGDGTSSINTLISNWNTANPSNQVTLTSGNGTQVPDAGTYASFSGTILGTSTPVVITSNVLGTNGDTVVLYGDGTSDISTLISNWNTAHGSNTITLTSGDGTQIPAGNLYASFTGTPAGLSTPITLTALTAGANGNSIMLVGDGTSSIDTLVANWNINNPSNTATLNSGNGAQIPTALTDITLSGGVNGAVVNLTGGTYSDIVLSGGVSATQFSLISGGVVVGDLVRIGSPFNTLNQGEWKIVAVTATSFSVANLIAVAEGPYILGSAFASEIQIYSAAGVQVNDTLVISGGFSPVTWGSYLVTAVAANWLQFYTTAALPQQSGIVTEIALYEYAKRFIYMETNQNVTVTINGTQTANIEPWEIGTSTFPGQYMQKATIYSLSVTNTSTNAANLVLCSIE
jgi:hypothetical protein